MAHTGEEIQIEERGNDYNLYQSAFESVITHYHQVDRRFETEGLKEKKCAKENDKAKGNKLAIPSAPIPVAAPVPNAVVVDVVDTNPLYDDIIYPQTQSPRKKPRKPLPTLHRH